MLLNQVAAAIVAAVPALETLSAETETMYILVNLLPLERRATSGCRPTSDLLYAGDLHSLASQIH